MNGHHSFIPVLLWFSFLCGVSLPLLLFADDDVTITPIPIHIICIIHIISFSATTLHHCNTCVAVFLSCDTVSRCVVSHLTWCDCLQVVVHCSRSVSYTPYGVLWVPCSARFVALGMNPRGSGVRSLHFSSIHFNSLHYSSIQFTIQFTIQFAIQFTSLHFTSLTTEMSSPLNIANIMLSHHFYHSLLM